MRVGVSFVSADGARKNLAKESGQRSFADLAAAARASWNERLGRIAVTGGTDAQRATFYTALYHSLLQPNTFSDVDGRYPGFDGRVHTAPTGHATYTNFSGWDTYRSQSQLVALIAPAEASDIAGSMTAFAEQGGSWDRWTVANGYTGVMVGDPYHAIVANSYAFGARDFDARKALLLMLRGATQPTQGYQERPGLADYQRLGYVPTGAADVWGPAATTLEYTTADFAIADLARRLGDPATYTTFSERAQYWQNLYNPATGYLQQRNADGSFAPTFDPASGEGWVEGNGAQYTWMVPYDAEGLITAMGGRAAVVDRLDEFFTELNAGPEEPYAFLGNEPTMQTPWLYDYAGVPAKAQDVTRRAMGELYNPTESGLVGNDDLGQMSSWYVWAAMGMYPAVPGRAELVLSSPLFTSVTITRPGGVTLTVKAPGASQGNRYVTGLTVDGAPSTRTFLPESFVTGGGTVEFALSGTPDPVWGTGPDDAPPSFRDGEVGQRGFVDPGRAVVPAGGAGTVQVGAQDFSGAGATVGWSASPPAGITVAPASGQLVVPPGGRTSSPVTVRVAAGVAEGTYRIPVAFTSGDDAVVQVRGRRAGQPARGVRQRRGVARQRPVLGQLRRRRLELLGPGAGRPGRPTRAAGHGGRARPHLALGRRGRAGQRRRRGPDRDAGRARRGDQAGAAGQRCQRRHQWRADHHLRRRRHPGRRGGLLGLDARRWQRHGRVRQPGGRAIHLPQRGFRPVATDLHVRVRHRAGRPRPRQAGCQRDASVRGGRWNPARIRDHGRVSHDRVSTGCRSLRPP